MARQAEVASEMAGDGAFSRACRAIDCDDGPADVWIFGGIIVCSGCHWFGDHPRRLASVAREDEGRLEAAAGRADVRPAAGFALLV
jgi:hypothetical protein